MLKKLLITVTALFFLINSPASWGNECAKCHMENNVKEEIPRTEPIVMKADGKTRSITLQDAFEYHSHSCPGVANTFFAMQYGIKLLYGTEIPEVNDLVVISRSPAPGSMDMIDFLLINKKGERKTQAPKEMKSGRDKFYYTIYSKSRNMAVDIQLKPEHYPEDFFVLKKKQANNTISEDEWQTFHGYMRDMIKSFPTMSFEELFGSPQPYRVILWGD